MKIIFFLNDFLNQFLVRFSRQINGLLLILAHLVLLGLFFPRQRNSFGQLAINLLLIILFMSPLAQITRARLFMYLLRFRRPLGIAMAYAALVHFFGFVSDSIFFNYVFVQNWPHNFLNSWRLVFGVLALLLALPLLFTSNKFSVRKLGRKWKKLHRLVYVVFIAAAIHQNLRAGLASAVLAALPLIIIYSYLKLVAVYPQALPGLTKLLVLIDQKYLAYKVSQKAAADQSIV